MRKHAFVLTLLAASSVLLTIANAPAVEQAPMRKLVYSFERAIDQDVSVKTQPSPEGWKWQSQEILKASRSGQQFSAPGDQVPQNPGDVMESTESSSAGIAGVAVGGHAGGESSGTIEVDVLREQPDHGLVVSIREPSTPAGATPVTCVVYASTSLTCGAQNPNPEEYALLRFLGDGFVDPSQMDAKRHWHISQSGGGLDAVADYQIVNDADGTLTIDESQTIGSKSGIAATIRSTIGYDFNRALPTSIDEHVVQNQQAGAQNAARSVHTVLRLVSATP